MVNWFCRFEKLLPSTNSTSGSNSGPSTRESGNVVVPESEEQEELRDSEPHPVETVQDVEHQEPSSHEQDVEGIKVFNPDVHLVSFDHFLYGKLSGHTMEQKFSLCALHVKGNHVQTSYVPFVC